MGTNNNLQKDVDSIRKILNNVHNVKGQSHQEISIKCEAACDYEYGNRLSSQRRKEIAQAIADSVNSQILTIDTEAPTDISGLDETSTKQENSLHLGKTKMTEESSQLTTQQKSDLASQLISESGLSANQQVVSLVFGKLQQVNGSVNECRAEIKDLISIVVEALKNQNSLQHNDLITFTNQKMNELFIQKAEHEREFTDFFGQICQREIQNNQIKTQAFKDELNKFLDSLKH